MGSVCGKGLDPLEVNHIWSVVRAASRPLLPLAAEFVARHSAA